VGDVSRQGRVKRVFYPVLRFSAFYQVQLTALEETTTASLASGCILATGKVATQECVSLLVIQSQHHGWQDFHCIRFSPALRASAKASEKQPQLVTQHGVTIDVCHLLR
jgi:hypothetical protein